MTAPVARPFRPSINIVGSVDPPAVVVLAQMVEGLPPVRLTFTPDDWDRLALEGVRAGHEVRRAVAQIQAQQAATAKAAEASAAERERKALEMIREAEAEEERAEREGSAVPEDVADATDASPGPEAA